jgi:F-type H+-transporting ATPase subunit delta
MTNVLITTAIKLTSAQVSKITKAVEKKYGSDLNVTAKVDPSILGGIVLTVNSRQLDNSIQTKLNQVKQILIERYVEAKS